MEFKGIDILTTRQFDRQGLGQVFQLASEYLKALDEGRQLDVLKGKMLAALFYEPSTRTRLSFETAMHRLGGTVASAVGMEYSSLKKGETLYDTGRVVSQFVDVIAMRHPAAGSVAELAEGSTVPVLNGGDGPANHPTQGLLDLYTIEQSFGTIDGLTIGLIGDLKYSRVFHSEAQLLSHYKVHLVLVSPKELPMPEDILADLTKAGVTYEVSESVVDVLPRLDVLSTNRIQEERFPDRETFERLKKTFIFDKALIANAKEKSIILNPLPRVDELKREVDDDPRAKYFQQVRNGVAIRMALLSLVMGKA
jgi:aspartate carbamoyltransferase catalytic subunit